MLDRIFVFVCLLLLVSGVSAFSIAPPTSWTDSVESGGTLQKTFTVTAAENDSVTLTLSGNIQSWMHTTVGSSPLTNDTDSFEVFILIPENTSTGLYTGSIDYSGTADNGETTVGGSIVVVLNVQQAYTGSCTIMPLTGKYITSLKQGATASKSMSVLVSGDCDGPVEIKDIDVTGGGTISTETGKKPVRIQDAALGAVNPGQECTFTAFLDSTGMGPGTYTPTATITAIHKGMVISTGIAFEVTITGITSPIGGDEFITLPDYDIPNNIKSGDEFQIRVTHLDPNLDMKLLPNDRLYGKPVQRTEDTWIWKGYINGTGQVLIELYPEYKGAQVGSIIKKTILISSGPGAPVGSSGQLKFEFFPAGGINIGGTTVNFLVKDNVTNNIVEGSSVYLNGIIMAEQKLTVLAGEEYCLSATASDYSTLDFCFTPQQNKLTVYITPETPMVGDYITITTRDSNNAGINATLYLNENKIGSNTFQVGFEGNYTVRAEMTGYDSTSISFSVSEPIGLLEAPESLSKGDRAKIVLTKNVSYRVLYRTELGAEAIEIVSGTGTEIEFKADEPGFYYVEAKGEVIRQYPVEGRAGIKWPSLKFPSIPKWLLTVIVAIIVVVVIFIVRSKRGSSRMVGYGAAGGGGEADEVVEDTFGL